MMDTQSNTRFKINPLLKLTISEFIVHEIRNNLNQYRMSFYAYMSRTFCYCTVCSIVTQWNLPKIKPDLESNDTVLN